MRQPYVAHVSRADPLSWRTYYQLAPPGLSAVHSSLILKSRTLSCGLLESTAPTGLYGTGFIRGVGLGKKVRRSKIKECRLRRLWEKKKSDFEVEIAPPASGAAGWDPS